MSSTRAFCVSLACLAACASRNSGSSSVGDAGVPKTVTSTGAGAADAGSTGAGAPSPGSPSAQLDAGATDAGAGAGSGAAGGSGAGTSGVDAGPSGVDAGPATTPPSLAGCQILPANHIFNTPIADQPVSASSASYLATIGSARLRLDTGTDLDQTQPDFYGIPYNVVHGSSMTWTQAAYYSADTSLDWDPRAQSDCATSGSGAILAPCTTAAAPRPVFPIPATPLVQDGINPALTMLPYADHRMIVLDADTCRLWELAHAYPSVTGGWFIYGSASFDLSSNQLRPAGWTSVDAAGLPVLPLLLRAEEASNGVISHALRFTVASNKIRTAYTWPARHLTTNGTASTQLPPMGQLFRLKASYVIPASDGVQAQAILTALKTYGMYLADGGLDLYLTGSPSPLWEQRTFNELNAVPSDAFEAVDLGGIQRRPGFDPDSGAVP